MIIFKKIDKNNDKDIKELFDLIKVRKYKISHTNEPNFKDHKNFVKNNPYRKWMFIFKDNSIIGSFYITFENYIGINIVIDNKNLYLKTITLLLSEFKPLPEIKSIRNKFFLFNSSPENKEYIKALEELNMNHIQNTYSSNSQISQEIKENI